MAARPRTEPWRSTSSRWCPNSCVPSISWPARSRWRGSRNRSRTGKSGADSALLTFELVTLFPEIFDDVLGGSLLGKAIGAGLIAVHRTNLRDFGIGRHRSV